MVCGFCSSECVAYVMSRTVVTFVAVTIGAKEDTDDYPFDPTHRACYSKVSRVAWQLM